MGQQQQHNKGCDQGRRACLRGPNRIAKALSKSLPDVNLADAPFSVCVDNVSDMVGRPVHDVVALTLHYSVCVHSLITPLSWALLKLHDRVFARTTNSMEEYLDLPCIIEDAIDIVIKETNEIQRIKDKAEREKVNAHTRRTR